jgi:hypothetical protein
MSKGFDANVDLTRFASCLRSAGYDFVCRYYNINNPHKNLTLGEVHSLSAAGLSIVAVWENGFPDHAPYFSHAKGVFDGTSAYHFAHENIGQSVDTPIYFAVDFDASQKDVNGVITTYFQGIIDAFNTISGQQPVYQIGVYGSGLTCSSLLTAGLVQFTWLAQSMGFRGSKTFKNFNIKQLLEKRECKTIQGGVAGDPDTSPGNEGSFKL